MQEDPASSAEWQTSAEVKAVDSFDKMHLKEDLLRGLYAYGENRARKILISRLMHHRRHGLAGFEKPSAIQQRAIVPITNGRDVVAQAQSGTGKSSLISVVTCQLVDTQLRE